MRFIRELLEAPGKLAFFEEQWTKLIQRLNTVVTSQEEELNQMKIDIKQLKRDLFNAEQKIKILIDREHPKDPGVSVPKVREEYAFGPLGASKL